MSQFPSFAELALILVKPREVIRKIISANPRKHFVWIALMLGFLGCLDMSALGDLGSKYSISSILIASLVLAFPYGYAILSLFSVTVFWVSKLFKGRANYFETRAAISWAFAPRVLNIVFWGVNIALVGVAAFHLEDPITILGPTYYTYQLTTFLMALLVIWTWVSSLQTLSEVNGYSAWISLAVVVLSTFAIMGFWVLISMLFTILHT